MSVAPLIAEAIRRIDGKVGVPGHEELAMGAVASGGVLTVNQDVVAMLGISDEEFQHAVEKEIVEIRTRERTYRGDRAPLRLADRTVIMIDDGLATGASMRAAVAAVRTHAPARIAVAVPVAPPTSCEGLRSVAETSVPRRNSSPLRRAGITGRTFAHGDHECS